MYNPSFSFNCGPLQIDFVFFADLPADRMQVHETTPAQIASAACKGKALGKDQQSCPAKSGEIVSQSSKATVKVITI